MSSNPLEDDPERELRVRDRAYHLWDHEGRPPGRDAEFWERARELVGMEESAGSGQLPNPISTGQDPSRAQPVEEAFLQENLGEFPSRFTDQGETQPTPMARHDSAPVKAAPETPPAARPAAKKKPPARSSAPAPKRKK